MCYEIKKQLLDTLVALKSWRWAPLEHGVTAGVKAD